MGARRGPPRRWRPAEPRAPRTRRRPRPSAEQPPPPPPPRRRPVRMLDSSARPRRPAGTPGGTSRTPTSSPKPSRAPRRSVSPSRRSTTGWCATSPTLRIKETATAPPDGRYPRPPPPAPLNDFAPLPVPPHAGARWPRGSVGLRAGERCVPRLRAPRPRFADCARAGAGQGRGAPLLPAQGTAAPGRGATPAPPCTGSSGGDGFGMEAGGAGGAGGSQPAPSPPGCAVRGVPWCPRAGVPRLPRTPRVAVRGLRPLPLADPTAPSSRPLTPLPPVSASLLPLAVPHRSRLGAPEAGGAALTPTTPLAHCCSPVLWWAGEEIACVQMVSVKRRRFLLSPPLSPVTSSVISV